MNKSFKFSGMAVIAMIALATNRQSAMANSVTNGDFLTTPAAGSFTTIGIGSTYLSGWDVISGSVDVIGTYWPTPPGGGQAVDLDGNSPGAIGQALTGITAGNWYDVTFALAANSDGPPTTKKVQVKLTPGGATSFTADRVINAASNSGWISESFYFKATSNSEYISFTSLDPAGGPYGPVLANVSVNPAVGGSPVPLPKAAGISFGLLGGFGTLAALRRRLFQARRIA